MVSMKLCFYSVHVKFEFLFLFESRALPFNGIKLQLQVQAFD